MKKSNQTQAEKVEQFVQQVQESETQKAKDNRPKSAEEEEADRKAFFDHSWQELPQVDKYLIYLVNNMQELSRQAMSVLSSSGRDYINARLEYENEKQKKV